MATYPNHLEGAEKRLNTLNKEFKDISQSTRDTIDFSKVRGSVRLMARKVKTPKDVANLVKKFLALRLP